MSWVRITLATLYVAAVLAHLDNGTTPSESEITFHTVTVGQYGDTFHPLNVTVGSVMIKLFVAHTVCIAALVTTLNFRLPIDTFNPLLLLTNFAISFI